MNKIKAIEIDAFRGIPHLKLVLDGKHLIIRGENGTGKTSLIDSLEFFFTGSLSAFQGEGTQDLSIERHGPNKSHDMADVSVKVTFSSGNITLERKWMLEPEVPNNLKNYFDEANKRTFILRRSQILEFIVSKPSDRFRAVASIIGIEQLDNIELSMKRTCDYYREGLQTRQAIVNSIYTNISNELGHRVTSGAEALQQLNSKLVVIGLRPVSSFKDLSALNDEFFQGMKGSGDLDKIGKLDSLKREVDNFVIDKEIINIVNETAVKIQPLLDQKNENELRLRDFLSAGIDALENLNTSRCPLCEQEINKDDTIYRVRKRFQILNELSLNTASVKENFSQVDGKIYWQTSSILSIANKIKDFESLDCYQPKLSELIQRLLKLRDRYLASKDLLPGKSMPKEEFEAAFKELEILIASLKQRCNELFQAFEVAREWKVKLESINLANRIAALSGDIEANERNLITLQKKLKLSETIYRTFCDAKNDKIREIYDAMKNDINLFYRKLHPNEQHNDIELSVIENRRASTQLRIKSFGSIEDPRAYASEGHLDSLGLCIFLAFAKKFNQDCSLLLLDDIVTTVDASHRSRIAELLFSDFSGHQLIVTTHDSIWYEQLESAQNSCGIGGKCKNIEIVKWSLEFGPQIEPYRSNWESIKERLQSGDKRTAGEEGRIYLEWVLRNIALNTQTKIILKVDRYTVGDYYDSVKSRLIQVIRDPTFKQMVQNAFIELNSTRLMGNLLSHNNPDAGNISLEEVENFCLAVHSLAVLLKCPECNTFLRHYQDFGRLRCSNRNCSLPTEI